MRELLKPMNPINQLLKASRVPVLKALREILIFKFQRDIFIVVGGARCKAKRSKRERAWIRLSREQGYKPWCIFQGEKASNWFI